jgi:hypothetical protein
MFIEDQAFSPSYDLAPPPPPSPLSGQQVVSRFKSSCVSPVELTDGRRGRGWGRSQIVRRRVSLVLHISLNTLWLIVCQTKICCKQCKKCMLFDASSGPFEALFKNLNTLPTINKAFVSLLISAQCTCSSAHADIEHARTMPILSRFVRKQAHSHVQNILKYL